MVLPLSTMGKTFSPGGYSTAYYSVSLYLQWLLGPYTTTIIMSSVNLDPLGRHLGELPRKPWGVCTTADNGNPACTDLCRYVHIHIHIYIYTCVYITYIYVYILYYSAHTSWVFGIHVYISHAGYKSPAAWSRGEQIA